MITKHHADHYLGFTATQWKLTQMYLLASQGDLDDNIRMMTNRPRPGAGQSATAFA